MSTKSFHKKCPHVLTNNFPRKQRYEFNYLEIYNLHKFIAICKKFTTSKYTTFDEHLF